jgi:hypothetical protein
MAEFRVSELRRVPSAPNDLIRLTIGNEGQAARHRDGTTADLVLNEFHQSRSAFLP